MGSVVLTVPEAALVNRRAVVITHNHPHGTTLSADDVLSAIDLGVREVHAFGYATRFRMTL